MLERLKERMGQHLGGLFWKIKSLNAGISICEAFVLPVKNYNNSRHWRHKTGGWLNRGGEEGPTDLRAFRYCGCPHKTLGPLEMM